MSIQYDNTNPGTITLKPGASGSCSIVFPTANAAGALTSDGAGNLFWGGEPFVYWKTLKPLAERLRLMYPNANFSIITNGSLLDVEKNEWLDNLGFSVGISHDDPGYHVRGIDPMNDSEQRAAILDLYHRLKPKGRVSINAMVHNGNQSRSDIQKWMIENFGADVIIGEGAFIDPYDEGGLDSVLKQESDHFEYRKNAFKDIQSGNTSSFHITKAKVIDFIESITMARPASSLGQKCGMDKKENIAVDLRGNVLTCQNVSAVSTAPNGQGNKLGNISNMEDVKLNTSTHWSKRGECPSCPVLQLCQGSCMFLEGNLWDAGCDASYSDNIPFFVSGIELMTGYTVSRIDGDFRESRKDIFGVNTKTVKSKKVIPIQAI